MNKRGQSTWLAITIAIMIFIAGMLMVNFIKQPIDSARTDMSCSAPASDGAKITCLLIDFTMSYWFVGIISMVIGLIAARFII
jgi:hypothetical protein